MTTLYFYKLEERVLHEDSTLSGYTVMSCTTAHHADNILVALGNSTGLLRIILLDPSLKVIGLSGFNVLKNYIKRVYKS